MGTLLKALGYFCISLFLAEASQAKEWRGIVPLKSTRADVERLLGTPSNNLDNILLTYYLPHEIVHIQFAGNPGCRQKWPYDSWDVSHDTVTGIRVSPRKQRALPDLKVDLTKFKKVQADYDVIGHFYYVSEGEGYSIEVFEPQGSRRATVRGYIYGPGAKDAHLRCKPPDDMQPAPNNGMHPTADTRAFMLRQWLGAAGDARVRLLLSVSVPLLYDSDKEINNEHE